MTVTTITETLAANLLAEDAATAGRHTGPCHLCQRAMLAGQRYAIVVPDGKAAHLPCIAAVALRRAAQNVLPGNPAPEAAPRRRTAP